MKSLNLRRLVVIDPICDVLDSRRSKIVGRVVSLSQARTEPSDGPFAGELLDHAERPFNHSRLILFMMNGALLKAMCHEFPICILASLRHTRIVQANSGIQRNGWGNA